MLIVWIMFFSVVGISALGSAVVEKYNLRQPYNNHTNLFFAAACLVMPLIIIGGRSNVADTAAYIDGYLSLSVGFDDLATVFSESKSPVYVIYQMVLKNIFKLDSYTSYLMITAFISLAGMFRLYYKYSTNYPFTIYLFFASASFVWMMNGIRQFIVVAVIAFFADWIFEKKTIPFLILIFILYYVHSSVIIWVPIYFIIQGKPFSFKIVSIILLTIVILSSISTFTSFLDSALENTNYAGYTQQFEGDDGSNIITTIILAVPMILAFWKRKVIEEKAPYYIKVMVNLSVAATAVSLVANFTSGILIGRMPIYFSVFNYILLPWLIENAFEGNDRNIIKVGCTVFYFAYIYYYLEVVMGWVIYRSTFLNINPPA